MRRPGGNAKDAASVTADLAVQHVAFLGSTSIDGGDRPRFWYEVTTCLIRLSNRVSPQDRERIGEAISKKVGGHLLTKAELAKFERMRDELLQLK